MDKCHTFVVPAYGCSPHLRECLDSLRLQTVHSLIIIVTSTPSIGLERLAAEFGVRLAVHSPSAGIGRDWNFALTQVATPWVTIAHQDDIYLPAFAERTLALAERHDETVLVATGYAELLEPEGLRRSASPMLAIKRLLMEFGFLGRSVISSIDAKRRLLRFGCPIPCPSVSLRIDLDAVRFREDLKVDLDWEAWLQLAARPGAFAYDRRVLMLHRIHRDSETSVGVRAGVRASEDRMMFEALWPLPIARLLAKAYSLSYETGS